MENWKFINANYEVSNKGNIKSVNYRGTGKSAIRKQSISKNGYMRVILSDNGKNKTYFVHRLVAAAFIPNPDNLPEIDHIDGNRANNDATNLRWCTRKQNLNYQKAINNKRETMKKVNTWFKKTGKDNHNAKPVYQYDLEGNFIKKWDCIHDAQRCGFNHGNIISCCKGRLKHYKKYIWIYE